MPTFLIRAVEFSYPLLNGQICPIGWLNSATLYQKTNWTLDSFLTGIKKAHKNKASDISKLIVVLASFVTGFSIFLTGQC